MQVVREPDTETALRFLQNAVKGLHEGKGRLVEIVGDCEVSYQGRATSTLHRGERLVLLKPDGTLLVHTAVKAKPINWQPPGASFHAAVEDGLLVLTALRTKPEEIVKLTFHEVQLLVSVPLRDGAELALVGSEADLQKLLYDYPDLVEPGFRPRRRERDSKRGFYDIDGEDRDGRRLVVEVKRTTAGVKEAQQLWRYVEQLRNGDAGEEMPRIRGILVAPRVAEKARGLLADHRLEWKELDWNEVLPQVQKMRHGGQVPLGRFAT